MDTDAMQQAAKTRRAHTVLTIEDWILWNWMDPPEDKWSIPFDIFHKCGIERAQAVIYRNGIFVCARCTKHAPAGLVAVYEMMNWEAYGYGG